MEANATIDKTAKVASSGITGGEVGAGVCVGVGVGVGVGSGVKMFGVACGFALFKNGTNVTMPKLKSFLKSKIVWLMACALVVPHQLFAAFTLAAVESTMVWVLFCRLL